MGLALIFNHHSRDGKKNVTTVITARSLPGGDPECLCRHPHWTLHLELLVLGSPDQVLAHLLQRLHVPGGQGDPDPVDRRLLLNSLSILDKILLSCMLKHEFHPSILSFGCQ